MSTDLDYLQQLYGHTLLSDEDEKRYGSLLLIRVQAEDNIALAEAREDYDRVREYKIQIDQGNHAEKALIAANYRLVKYFVGKFLNEHRDQPEYLQYEEDLISEGFRRLELKVKDFDIRKNYKFSTYYGSFFHRDMINFINGISQTLKRPTKVANDLAKAKKTLGKLESEGIEPSFEMFRKYYPETISEATLRRYYERIIHYKNIPLVYIEDIAELEGPENTAIDRITQDQLSLHVRSIIEGHLTESESYVLKRCMGLDGNGEKVGATVIAKQEGKTYLSIKATLNQALAKIKMVATEMGLDAIDEW